jgi:uncharacterized protein YtpQ (UPF0354 family)
VLASPGGKLVAVDWVTALQHLGGRLVPVALEFVDSRGPPPSGGGAAGVRWLADQLELHLEGDDELADDHRFVEGAGAFLGLLLIEHLGGRAMECGGAHRIQIGRFGWFDPFEAIEETLSAENPRRCLSEYLEVAEREASGRGPVSRVVRLFSHALNEERPDLRIESRFELSVELSNGASVDLKRLERIASGQDDGAVLESARRVIRMLSGTRSPALTTWHEAASRIVPRLVSERFLQSLPNEKTLYAERLGVDVYLALQLRYETRSRYLRGAELDCWAVPRAQAKHQALANLIALSRSVRVERPGDGIVRVRQGDGLDAARLLLPDLAARLARVDETTNWLAAVPHRDALLLGGVNAMDTLATQAADAFSRAPHPISAAVFALGPEGPRPL